jgi:hypothetical protein
MIAVLPGWIEKLAVAIVSAFFLVLARLPFPFARGTLPVRVSLPRHVPAPVQASSTSPLALACTMIVDCSSVTPPALSAAATGVVDAGPEPLGVAAFDGGGDDDSSGHGPPVVPSVICNEDDGIASEPSLHGASSLFTVNVPQAGGLANSAQRRLELERSDMGRTRTRSGPRGRTSFPILRGNVDHRFERQQPTTQHLRKRD